MIIFLLSINICNSEAIILEPETVGYVYSDGFWYPTRPGDLRISQSNKDGLAYRFILNESYDISGIFGSLTGVDTDLNRDPSPGRAQFFLMQGSKCFSGDCSIGLVPNTSSFPDNPDVLYKSKDFEVPLTERVNETPVEGTWYGESGLNINLPASDYWFGARGGVNDGYIRVSDYRFEGNVVPEPSTILLLASGLTGAFLRRRKTSTN